MRAVRFAPSCSTLCALAFCAPAISADAPKAGPTDAQLIASASVAAPPDLAKDTTVAVMEAGATMRTLRAGTNGFTCMQDNEVTPGPYVMWAVTPFEHLMAPVV